MIIKISPSQSFLWPNKMDDPIKLYCKAILVSFEEENKRLIFTLVKVTELMHASVYPFIFSSLLLLSSYFKVVFPGYNWTTTFHVEKYNGWLGIRWNLAPTLQLCNLAHFFKCCVPPVFICKLRVKIVFSSEGCGEAQPVQVTWRASAWCIISICKVSAVWALTWTLITRYEENIY